MSAQATEVCSINIGPKQRRMRHVFGIVGVAIGGLIAAALVTYGVARPWRALLFVPFFAGALGILQARGKT